MLYNWAFIWKNLSSVFVIVNEREVLYKYLHEILPTKKRLKDIRSIASSKCDHCEQEESNIHFVFQCEKNVEMIDWLKGLLQKFCNISNPQLIKLSFLLTPSLGKKYKNSVIFLMSTYIVSMWQLRQSNMNVNAYKNYIKSKLLKKKGLIQHILGSKMENLLPENICHLSRSDF